MISTTPYVLPGTPCPSLHTTLPKPYVQLYKHQRRTQSWTWHPHLPQSLHFIFWPMESLCNQSLKLKYLIVLDSFLSLCYNIQSSHQLQSILFPRYSIYCLKNITYLWRTHSMFKMLPWLSLSSFCSIPTAPVQIKAFITPSFSLQNTILACVQASSFLTHLCIFSTVTRIIFPKTQI